MREGVEKAVGREPESREPWRGASDGTSHGTAAAAAAAAADAAAATQP